AEEVDPDFSDGENVFAAPELVILEDHEKFRYEHGAIFEIEARGVRANIGLFFRTRDVALMLGRDPIVFANTITDKRKGFILGVDADSPWHGWSPAEASWTKNVVSDDALVLKWGQTEDLRARILKHRNDYGRIRGVSLELVKFILIDKLWCSECETTIAHFFSDAGWCLDSSGLEELQSGTSRAQKRKELAVVPRAVLKQIVLFYEGQQAKFGGNLKEFMVENQQLTKDLANLKDLCEQKLDHLRELMEEKIKGYEQKIAHQSEMAKVLAITHELQLERANCKEQ
ncbi:hypothetical protein HKX48_004020, partial [Thoreauomyces humboldtii]